MAARRGWHKVQGAASADGIATYELTQWSHFHEFLETVVFAAAPTLRHEYIWRGQRRLEWSLSTSLDRLFDRCGVLASSDYRVIEERAASHLEAFKYAARGRRGHNPRELSVADWWALGQHYGLATPLLDWTRSPFAAAYFAFEELDPAPSSHRVVFGLNRKAVRIRNSQIDADPEYGGGRLPTIEFFDPFSDENARLVSQGGLFTRAPIGMPIEQWIARAFEGELSAALIRVKIPATERDHCLRALGSMNINHLSLFPDLAGASRHANLHLELE